MAQVGIGATIGAGIGMTDLTATNGASSFLGTSSFSTDGINNFASAISFDPTPEELSMQINPGQPGSATLGQIFSASGLLSALISDSVKQQPDDYAALRTIHKFQKANKIDPMTSDILKQMATTGYYQDKQGKYHSVSASEQDAAKTLLSNEGSLFRALQGSSGNQSNGGSNGNGTGAGDLTFTYPETEAQMHTRNETAATTMLSFQTTNKIDPITVQQVAEMAHTGYVKDASGKEIPVSRKEQQAARAMLANNGELFKKLESATDGQNDGHLGIGDLKKSLKSNDLDTTLRQRYVTYDLDDSSLDSGRVRMTRPTDSSAAQTINTFQKDHKIALISKSMVQQIADTGYYTDASGNLKPVSAEVRLAAKAMMADNATLFNKLESATNGQNDGLLGEGDYTEAIKKKLIVADPKANNATDSYEATILRIEHQLAKQVIAELKDNNDLTPLTQKQIVQAAKTGYYTLPDGTLKAVTTEQQNAAKALLAYEAGMQGLYQQISATSADPAGTRTISDSDAAKKIHQFQDKNDIGLLSIDQVAEMASTGYCTVNGKKIACTPEQQLAAKAMMANNSELFKKLEAAGDGTQDGQLGMDDYWDALAKKIVTADIDKEGAPGNTKKTLPIVITIPVQTGNGSTVSPVDVANLIPVRNGSIDTGEYDDSDDTDNLLPIGSAPYHPARHYGALPSSADAAAAINAFQKANDLPLISVTQIAEIARAGQCTKADGTVINCPELQAAAKKMLANDSELFKSIESASNGKFDGLLGEGDYTNIKSKLSTTDARPAFNSPITIGTDPDDGADLPSDSVSAKRIHDFQLRHNLGTISIDEIAEMAENGTFTKADGSVIKISPAMQKAAEAMLADNSALFKSLESATNGQYDGELGQSDYDQAIKKGLISPLKIVTAAA